MSEENTSEEVINKAEKWDLVESLDFVAVKLKVLKSKSWWWKLKHDIGDVESEYRQFLYLIAINPGKTVVPWTQDVDDFWHQHILDTKKYREDCEKVFGRFIDHNPHLPQGTSENVKASNDTKQMYKEAFKDRVKEGETSWGGSPHAGCGSTFIAVFCAANDPLPYVPSTYTPSSYRSSDTSSSASCGAGCSSSTTSSSSGSSCSTGSSCSSGSSCGSGCGGGGD